MLFQVHLLFYQRTLFLPLPFPEKIYLVYGNNQYQYCYLADQYPKAVNWDIDNILIVTIDIEVACENGFPNPEQAIEPHLSITVKNHQNKQFVVWGGGLGGGLGGGSGRPYVAIPGFGGGLGGGPVRRRRCEDRNKGRAAAQAHA